MAVIYMKHARHGTKVAVSDEEAKADEKNGWERFTRESNVVNPEASDAAKPVPAPNEPTIVSREELAAEYERVLGKRPHRLLGVQRMADEIEAKKKAA